MQLEAMAIALRPRTAAEAIDLGYAMTQTWCRPVFGAWCAVYLPAALIITLLCWQVPVLAVFALWWLKPAFDRVVLHVLSGAAFGAIPRLGQTLRALPRLWWNSGLLAGLTYARFNMARSFTLPVGQLEGSRGKLARLRRRILGREGWSAATWLTIIALNIEVTLIASCYFLVNLFSPGDAAFQLSLQAILNPEISRSTQLFAYAVNVLAVSILEPFYVAAGFAIYLNSRTAIEGWDVELAFKRLAARIAGTKPATANVTPAVKLSASLLLGIGLCCGLQIPDAQAQSLPPNIGASGTKENPITIEPAPAAADEIAGAETIRKNSASPGVGPFTPDTGARKNAQEILRSPEFGHNRDGWGIRYTGPRWEESEPIKKRKVPWLEALIKFVAESTRVLAWIAVALVIAGLLYLLARYVSLNGWQGASKRVPPDMLFGLDVRPASLPDDLPGAARALLARGEMRAAVGLLYRGALVSLIHDGRIDVSRGDTEGDCLQRVQRRYASSAPDMAKAEYFGKLVQCWQGVAYARAVMNAAELTLLVDNWAQHFSRLAKSDMSATSMPALQAAA